MELVFAVLVFLALAVGFRLGRSVPPDDSLFGEAMALEPELGPLVLEVGTLELRGEVRTEGGEPATEAFLTLFAVTDETSRTSQAAPLRHAYTDAAGRFALRDLAPGPYRALLTHPSAPPVEQMLELPVAGEVTWTLGSPLPPLPVLPAIHRTTIRGTLSYPRGMDDAPLGGDAPLGMEGFEIVFRPGPDTPLLSGAGERRTLTDAQGSFTIDELVVADYRVEVMPPWATGGSWPILGSGACAARVGESPPLLLTLEVGTLEGVLEEADARPLVGALVTLTSLDRRDAANQPQLWPPHVSDEAGRFRVGLLPPGRYRVHLRAAAWVRDIDVVVESGRRTAMPRLQMAAQPEGAPPEDG